MSTPTRSRRASGRDSQSEGQPRRGRQSSGRTLVLVGSLLAIAVMLALPIRSWMTQQSNLDDLRVEIGAAQQRVDDLKAERDRWQDPVFIEQQARLRINMVMPGEFGLMTLTGETGPQTDPVEELPDTWWGDLWGSVEESSGRRPAETGSRDSGETPEGQ